MSETPAVRPNIDPAVFQAFDRLDDDQIVAEMRGATLKEYVYEFQQDGQTVRGLSKAGTDDASRHMALKYGETLREKDVVVEFQDADYAYFKAWAERVMVNNDGREVVLDAVVGQKRQPKFNTSRKTGEKWPNPFWYEQGGQKALRNAKQKLIPEPIKLALIDAYSKAGKTKQIGSSDVSTGKSPPAPERKAGPPLPTVGAQGEMVSGSPSPAEPAQHERDNLLAHYKELVEALPLAGLQAPGPLPSPISNKALREINERLSNSLARKHGNTAIEAANAEAEQMALASEEAQP